MKTIPIKTLPTKANFTNKEMATNKENIKDKDQSLKTHMTQQRL